VSIRADDRVGLWSRAAARLTGRRRWELQRRGVALLFRDPGAWNALQEELKERGRVPGAECVLVNAAGEDVPVLVHGARLPAPATVVEGAPVPDRYLLVFHDQTEVHRIRRRLIETEKLSAMAKIAGSVAHEFRNPLNSLFLATDLLEDELEGNEEVRGAIAPTLSAIREEIERLNQIIAHYLSLSKIATASPEVVDLGAAVRAFVAEHLPTARERGVDLRAKVEEGVHRVRVDPNQARRALLNLVENAFDAVAPRNPEEPDVEPTRPGRVTVLVRRMRRSTKLTVKDNGPGIPEDIRERVFEPFFTSKAGGSGLGLYLVREIALASGATMALSSAEGRGTSVSIRWPLRDVEGASARPHA
jgi:signal transduction histidine kinase